MKILIAGTFDNFHVGHQWLVWQAFSQSESLVVIVARDKTVEKIKGQLPRNNEVNRLKRVEQEFLGYKNVLVRLGRSDGDFIKTINEEKPDQISLGYDQQFGLHLEEKLGPKIKLTRLTAYQPSFFKSSKF